MTGDFQKRMVAFLDIQGFKGFLDRHGTKKAYEFFREKIFREVLQFLSMSINSEGMVSPADKMEDIFGFHWFSDSIILYSRKDDDEYHFIVLMLTNLLIRKINSMSELWIRCGVSYGELAADRDGIVVGVALKDAYELEQRQNWFGGALTESAEKKIDEIAKTQSTRPGQVLIAGYPIPMKSKCLSPKYAINWPYWSPGESSPIKPNLTAPDSNDLLVTVKYKNTLAFYTEVTGVRKKQYNPWRYPTHGKDLSK